MADAEFPDIPESVGVVLSTELAKILSEKIGEGMKNAGENSDHIVLMMRTETARKFHEMIMEGLLVPAAITDRGRKPNASEGSEQPPV